VLACSATFLLAQAGDAPPPGAARMQAAGSGTLTWFGIRAYDARLWVAPGFRADQYAQHALVLELRYLRAFTARDIARRSLAEMRRAAPIATPAAQDWEAQLAKLLPDVVPGDRIAGFLRPGEGARFLVNGRAVGDIADPRFAALFFGIWLAPTTSEPALRAALLANTAP
jgi:hypothetical protein